MSSDTASGSAWEPAPQLPVGSAAFDYLLHAEFKQLFSLRPLIRSRSPRGVTPLRGRQHRGGHHRHARTVRHEWWITTLPPKLWEPLHLGEGTRRWKNCCVWRKSASFCNGDDDAPLSVVGSVVHDSYLTRKLLHDVWRMDGWR